MELREFCINPLFVHGRKKLIPKLPKIQVYKFTGVRMQTPSVTNSSSTLLRDSTLQPPQVQPPQQPQSSPSQTQILGVNNNNSTQQLARAILVCRPNSHPFNNRTLYLEPLQEVKVGRSVARNRVADTNAIFDCKVLSRNHAVLWYNDGKFFIKDTGSSNGTFINNIRLSQTSMESEPYEVSSGDIVQFGVDVMENSRRETHGCIVATLKLFLPDGRETKASQSTLVGGINTKIPPVDLYRLNQYLQEANQREQILETKLISLQKSVEITKSNTSLNWQAMIDEDRLLSRIDMLEKKLQCFQKNMTDDKLREDILKLQDEKLDYQNSAKEALQKAYQDRLDASLKLSTIERALCSSEDECSLLREQLTKTQQQLHDATGRLETLQNQYDEKVSQNDEAIRQNEIEVENLKLEVKSLKEKIHLYEFCVSDEDDQDNNSSQVSHWLMKSDIKNVEGSEDIIKAICNDETEFSDECNLEAKFSKLQKKILNLEKNISIILDSEQHKHSLESDNSETNDTQVHDGCEGDQNMNNKTAPNINSELNFNILKRNFKHIKNDCTVLMKQISKINEDKQSEEILTKANCEALEAQLVELKQDLETRPLPKDIEDKEKICEELNEIISTIRIEAAEVREQCEKYQTSISLLESELLEVKNKENENLMKSVVQKIDVIIQTEEQKPEILKQITTVESEKLSDNNNDVVVCDNNKKLLEVKNNEKLEIEEVVVKREEDSSCSKSNNKIVVLADKTASSNNSGQERQEVEILDDSIDDELELINHPDVEREEELIMYKEKYSTLTEENIRLNQELMRVHEDYNNFRNKSLINLMMYLAPIIVIIAYILFNRVPV